MDNYRGQKRKFEPDILSQAPREINIVQYAQSRAAEIQALSKQVNRKNASSYVNTLMPRHMRRRAMAHNLKRFPRRVREKINIQGIKTKRPSRKYRRRPKNLLQEYNRRMRTNVWLETHIWHAKRFKMAIKWRYKIPIHPTQKGTRAAYRASLKSCLLRDMSYLCCIQLAGPEEGILIGLDHLTSSVTGPTFRAKSFLRGFREGHLMLYSYDSYPYDAIGCVTFMWQPMKSTDTTNHRQLWIWCHPSCYSILWNEVVKCFVETEKANIVDTSEEIVKNKECVDLTLPSDDSKKSSEAKNKANTETNAVVEIPSTSSCTLQEHEYRPKLKCSCTIGRVKLISLKDSLVRHRLIGPKSQNILASIVKPSTVNVDLNASGDSTERCSPLHWWQNYYADLENLNVYNAQRVFLEEKVYQCSSPAEVPAHTIIAATVRDPRLLRPDMKTSVTHYASLAASGITHDQLSPLLATSPIWDPQIRENVKTSKMSNHELHDLQSKQLVPGSPLHLGIKESRIPVLIIQNPGCNPDINSPQARLNYGAGWDLIIPAGWSMAFWMAFIYSGAHPIGLRDSESLAHEQQVLHFPGDYPDTMAGKEDNEEMQTEMNIKHDKRPPAKTPNYNKLGRVFPFGCPYQELVKEWMDSYYHLDTNKFFILRHKGDLNFLNSCFTRVVKGQKYQKVGKQRSPEETENKLKDLVMKNKSALVPIKISVIDKGAPEAMATVSVPLDEDLFKLKSENDYGGPVENMHPDLEKIHKKKQKLKAKLLKLDQATEKVIKKSAKESDLGKMDAQVTNENEKTLMKEDCVANEKSILTSCSRSIMGYLNHGGFSLSNGSGTGMGFCSLLALSHLYSKTRGNIVLIRNPKSFQYRFAYLYINCQ